MPDKEGGEEGEGRKGEGKKGEGEEGRGGEIDRHERLRSRENGKE